MKKARSIGIASGVRSCYLHPLLKMKSRFRKDYEMNKSEQINELASALAKVQAVLQPAGFDAVNPFYKSKYATLGSVIDVAKVMHSEGLSYMQPPVSDGHYVGIDNILMHESGQWISDRIMVMLPDDSKNMVQEAGKIITYLRRYGLASMFGIYSDEDTDGNNPPPISKPSQPVKTPQKPSQSDSARPYAPDELKVRIAEIGEDMRPASAKQTSLLASKLGEQLPDEGLRHQVQKFLFGAESLNDCPPNLVNAGLKWINLDESYQMSSVAVEELQSVLKLVQGKQKMDEVLSNF